MRILLLEGANYHHKQLKINNQVKLDIICEKSRLEKIDKNLYENIYIYEDYSDIEIIRIPKIKYDYAYCFSEKKQLLMHEICINNDIYFIGKKYVSLLSDKYKVRKRLRDKSLSHIECHKINSKEELKNLKINNSKILKPRDGIAGNGVLFIKDLEDIERLDKVNLNNYLVEDYILGKEYSVETFSYHKSHKIFCITEKLIDNTMNEVGHILPVFLNKELSKKIETFIREVLNALEVDIGICHIEIRIDDNNIEIIEVNPRIGGGRIGELLNSSFEPSLLECFSHSLLENKLFDRNIVFTKKYSQILSKFPDKDGVISDIRVPENFNGKLYQNKRVGDVVQARGNQNRIIYLMRTSEDFDYLKNTYLEVLSDIDISIK